jgi:hypothetical protein
MTKHMEMELDGFGTYSLRIIKGVTRIARVPNEVIYEQTGMKPLTRILRERHLRYLGHVLRLDDSEPAKIFTLYDSTHGHRKRGRPRLRFTEYVSSLIIDEPEGYTRDKINN